jgi:hypothetical protein
MVLLRSDYALCQRDPDLDDREMAEEQRKDGRTSGTGRKT